MNTPPVRKNEEKEGADLLEERKSAEEVGAH